MTKVCFDDILRKKKRLSRVMRYICLKSEQKMICIKVAQMISHVFLIGCVLLTSCQATHLPNTKQALNQQHASYQSKRMPPEKDGAPPGPLPEKFKQVIPVNAPLSRYGNPSAYHVNGHTYEVMTSSSGYRTRGLASWYGTKFHKQRTSSGEDYDMYALTAAHKTLPIPCYVKVKNLQNGREAIVKVNDRGPFHDGRVLDLSYAAAAKLGLFPKGTAMVEVEALTTTSAGHAQPAHYYLQAGAFESEKLAQALRLKLAKLSPSPVFIEKNQNRYLVRVGPFATKQMSDSLKNTLARNGVSGAFSLLM
jgi:rare lipoprotein A